MTIEEIEEHTQKRLEVYTENLKKLVKRWAGGDIKEWDPKSVDKVVNNRLINSTIRIGIGKFNTTNDIKDAANYILKVVNRTPKHVPAFGFEKI